MAASLRHDRNGATFASVRAFRDVSLSIAELTTDIMPKSISLTGVIGSDYDEDDGDSAPEVAWSFD